MDLCNTGIKNEGLNVKMLQTKTENNSHGAAAAAAAAAHFTAATKMCSRTVDGAVKRT